MICTLCQTLLGGQTKEDEMGGACSTHEMRNACETFIGKPDGKRSLGRPRCR